eukprot:CAMPEP_0171184212 /NCGR_PEP_ID=MMETSP0790-20130122/15673_1 /TAXON_ID=2925 /ORGANISM="Alexandrium catenella, Strain OF101" /LENGTH=227 /DNA_ID=CAMNT_0011649203 /DNA_START=139 /DNA_END=819 /DNA_ORIENTATION=+
MRFHAVSRRLTEATDQASNSGLDPDELRAASAPGMSTLVPVSKAYDLCVPPPALDVLDARHGSGMVVPADGKVQGLLRGGLADVRHPPVHDVLHRAARDANLERAALQVLARVREREDAPLVDLEPAAGRAVEAVVEVRVALAPRGLPGLQPRHDVAQGAAEAHAPAGPRGRDLLVGPAAALEAQLPPGARVPGHGEVHAGVALLAEAHRARRHVHGRRQQRLGALG